MKLIKYFILIVLFSNLAFSQTAESYTIELARMFSKDIFENNGVPFLQPVVTVVNGTSNTQYFNTAFVPKEVEKPYFKFSIQAMYGVVGDDMKTFKPNLPTKEFNSTDVLGFIKFKNNNPLSGIERLDTASLIHYIFLNLTYDGLKKGSLKVPDKAQTALGKKETSYFYIPNDTLKSLLKSHPLYSSTLIPQSLKDSLVNYVSLFPEQFAIYGGSQLNTIFAGVPQLEIGSFMGTEALIRFIPKINMGSTVGDFSFWGFGLKHSISQYFDDNTLDIAAQIVYQGTSLENKIGVTNAELSSNATMYNFNIQASKSFEGLFDVFTGFSYDMISIESSYLYKLGIELQWQLGLLEKDHYEPTPGYPGDLKPQKTNLTVNDDTFKWTFGLAKSIGNFRIYADYNISKFSILAGGLEYRF